MSGLKCSFVNLGRHYDLGFILANTFVCSCLVMVIIENDKLWIFLKLSLKKKIKLGLFLLNSFYFRVAIWWYSCLNCLNLHLGGFSWVHLLWWYKVFFGWFNPWWKASPCKIGLEFHVSAANFPSADATYLLLLFCPYIIANFILLHSLSLSHTHNPTFTYMCTP